ncbi:MAG: hypothetical protein ACOYNS_04780 [Bacteroidota bacterium]
MLPLILNGTASNVQINELVRIAHHFAVIRLKQLIGSGRLHLQSFPLTVESIAFDCIAEIFERDSDGSFIELQHYFSGERDPKNTSNDSLMIYFRSLVFTKLNDGIFRLYRENDPVFSKILRNIKNALERTPGILTAERFGIVFIHFAGDDQLNGHLPEFPLDELEGELTGLFRNGDSSGTFLEKLKSIFIPQTDYRRMISLFDCTLLLKRASAFHKVPLDDIFSSDASMLGQDIQSIVVKTLQSIQRDLAKRYVLSGKFSHEEFNQYYCAIEQMILDTYVQSDGSEKSYDQYLQQFMKGLTYDDYRSRHRVHFEYMVKLAKKAVKEQLKELL